MATGLNQTVRELQDLLQAINRQLTKERVRHIPMYSGEFDQPLYIITSCCYGRCNNCSAIDVVTGKFHFFYFCFMQGNGKH